MLDKNPLQVQRMPSSQSGRPTPLILIHDGGGTTFGYFSLGSLHRDVWAIHNPHFFTAEPWEGGMEEMARYYIGLIESAGIEGSVLLGGWSLGGYLSLSIARMLKDNPSPKITVEGLLLIDSPYHVALCRQPPSNVSPNFDGLPDLVRKSLDNCDVLLDKWDLPQWTGPAYGGKTVRFNVGGERYSLQDGSVLYKPLREDWRVKKTRTFLQNETSEQPAIPPPAVIVRCVGKTPTKTVSSEPCRVDRYRDEPFLGWDGNYPSFIKAAIDTDTHHYNIFDFAHVEMVTKQLNEALQILESLESA